MDHDDVVQKLETGGYWTTSDGDSYFLVDLYFTDRVTADVYYETHPVFVDDNVATKLGKEFWEYRDAINHGTQDLVEIDGVLHAGEIALGSPEKAFAALETNASTLADQSADLFHWLTQGHGSHSEDSHAMAHDDDAADTEDLLL